MAYTFDYKVIEAVTNYLNGEQLWEEEQTILLNLANAIYTSHGNGWPNLDDDSDEEE